MTYEGPSADESLPVGEETLSIEELDGLASCVFELEEVTRRHFPNLIAITDLEPARRKAVVRLQDEAIDSLKQGFIDNRE